MNSTKFNCLRLKLYILNSLTLNLEFPRDFNQILNWHQQEQVIKVSNLAISMPKDKHDDASSNNIESWTLLFDHNITRRKPMFLVIQFLSLIFVSPWNCPSIFFTCKSWWNTLTHDFYKCPRNRQPKKIFFFE